MLDDTLLGLIGTKQEAEAIKRELGNILKRIKLEMSEKKTSITNAKKEKARFLSYEVERKIEQTKKTKSWNGQSLSKKRSINGGLYFSWF